MITLTTKWLAMATVVGPLALYAEHRYRSLPELPLLPPAAELPALSIIIPARNEANNLQRLLPSLTSTSYPGTVEIIVVDDNSADDTARVARRLGARVISLTGIPEGWSGKTYACHRGAEAARGKWLLFTDADTVHQPQGPEHVVAYAEHKGLDGLSLFIQQMTSGVADRVAFPVAFAGLFIGLEQTAPVLNGQYVLLSRQAYAQSDGFAAVAGEVMEDLALGRHLHVNGFHVPLLRSDAVAFVQMYDDPAALWQGLVRLSSGSLRWLGARSIMTALFVTAAMAPILALLATFSQRQRRGWALASWALASAGFVPWARRFGAAWPALLAPVGALAVQAAGIWGLARRLSGRGMAWKGRRV